MCFFCSSGVVPLRRKGSSKGRKGKRGELKVREKYERISGDDQVLNECVSLGCLQLPNWTFAMGRGLWMDVLTRDGIGEIATRKSKERRRDSADKTKPPITLLAMDKRPKRQTHHKVCNNTQPIPPMPFPSPAPQNANTPPMYEPNRSRSPPLQWWLAKSSRDVTLLQIHRAQGLTCILRSRHCGSGSVAFRSSTKR